MMVIYKAAKGRKNIKQGKQNSKTKINLKVIRFNITTLCM